MGKMFKTKYSSAVDNDNLLRLGEMRIHISGDNKDKPLHMAFNKNVDLEIVGDGYFTDSTYTQNLGKKISYDAHVGKNLYLSNGNYDVAILDKYAITYLTKQHNTTASLDIDSLKYSTNIKTINFQGNSTGDLSSLSGFSKLTNIDLESLLITGDLSSLSGLSGLSTIDLKSPLITGDLSSLSGLSELADIDLGPKITGDVSSLSSLTKLERLAQFNVDTGYGIHGDFSYLGPKVSFVGSWKLLSGSWTAGRRTSGNIIAFQGVNFGADVDNVLIDLAKCDRVENAASYKIALKGTKTSASDDAVATLQGKGYTVVVNS